MDIGHFVERVLSDDKGMIECNNILVYNNGSLSQVYFVLKQLGLDEEQKITHIQISPRLDISPAYKKQGSLEGIKTLHFAKDIPKHIAQHDKINAQVRVNAIHKIDTIQAHNATQWAIPLSLKAEYVIKDKTKDTKDTQSLIAQYRHNIKWGYMVFGKHQDIHKELQKQGIILSPTQLNAQGEYVSIPTKEDWEGKNIAIFAYLKAPSKSVRYDIKHYRALPLSLRYNGKSLDLLSYGQILKSYKLSQTKNEYMRGHGHIELEQGIDINTTSLDTGTYMMTKTDIQSALILTSNKYRIDTPHLVKEFSPLAFECVDSKERFYISYNANHNNLNLIEYESLQRPINLKSPQIKKHIKIFLESRELFEDLAHIHIAMQNKGLDTLVLEVEGEDLSNIEVAGQNGMDISLVSEYSKNILRQIAKNSNYTRVVISSTARTPRRQAEIMYNNIITKGLQEQRNTYKQPGQRVLDVYEIQKKAGKNKDEIIQAMTNKINELGASNVSKHCADFNVVNVVDIPHSSLGANKTKFKTETQKLQNEGKITQILDENGCYHIVIPQPQN